MLPPDAAEEAARASTFRSNFHACLDAARRGAVQLTTMWTELLWFAITAATLSPSFRKELGEVAASLPLAALQHEPWRQLQHELRRLAGS